MAIRRGKEPRGIRNNNPANIERGNTNWRGMSKDQRWDNRFIIFDKPEYGIRAAARILRVYFRKYGLNTIEGIVSRWAPPVENDTEAYIRFVERRTGYGFKEKLDLECDKTLCALLKAMIHMENGVQPYDDKVLLAGIAMERAQQPKAKAAQTA